MIDIVINILTGIISILPMSPIAAYVDKLSEIPFLAMVNWFIPFDVFLGLLESWGICMGLYYIYRKTIGQIKQ